MNSSRFKSHLAYSVLGLLLGGVLTKIGFGDYDELHRMFILTDLRMLFSFCGAVLVSMVLLFILRKRIPMQNKFIQPGTIPGSLLFGFGWAVSGACPSLVFIQLGHGSLGAVFTTFGIILGTWLYRKVHARYFGWDVGSCGV
jgi:uncharacterized membrane protein YedE/YeeE